MSKSLRLALFRLRHVSGGWRGNDVSMSPQTRILFIHLPSYVDYPLGHPEDRSGAKDIDAL